MGFRFAGVDLVELKELGLTGFNTDEIDELMHSSENSGLTNEDAVSQVPEAAVSQPGTFGCWAPIVCCVATRMTQLVSSC